MTSRTLLDVLESCTQSHSDSLAFVFLEKGETVSSELSRQELFDNSIAVAIELQAQYKEGSRIAILNRPGCDYVISFYGCILAGIIPVPIYPPRSSHHADRLRQVLIDADVSAIIVNSNDTHKIRSMCGLDSRLARVSIIDEIVSKYADYSLWKRPDARPEGTAFLQYTSGSTSSPKGVMVTHSNIINNMEKIRDIYHVDAEVRALSWLPPYHDMGLIGGILAPVYCEVPSYLMNPLHFIQKPARWMQAISEFSITHSGGPNFGFDHASKAISKCDETISLSSWRCAFTGAEPIRVDTLRKFSKVFRPFGFNPTAFRASYGLAEATLLVCGSEPRYGNFYIRSLEGGVLKELPTKRAVEQKDTKSLVGIDLSSINEREIVVADKKGQVCPKNIIGEICISNKSVANGYWQKPGLSKTKFQSVLSPSFEQTYLRTGDSGAIVDGILYITGRLSELIIIRGLNHAPSDIELTCSNALPDIPIDNIFAVSNEVDDEERLIILIEIRRAQKDYGEALKSTIRNAILDIHGILPHDICFVKVGTLPRTSSGKKQRIQASNNYKIGNLVCLHNNSTSSESSSTKTKLIERLKPISENEMESKILEAISKIKECSSDQLDPEESFLNIGIDSVKGMELVGALTDRIGRDVSPTVIYEYPTPRKLSQYLTNTENRSLISNSTGSAPNGKQVPIAIVGMACRVPGANNLDQFWSLLCDGRDAIQEVPENRWKNADFYDPELSRPITMKSKWGGFINDFDKFDREFFGISQIEADAMDPQQRIMLECVWEAFENSGIRPSQLKGQKAGVFVGASGIDYSLIQHTVHSSNAYAAIGNASSIIANRISYYLDFRGPSLTIDTACSSSLAAVSMACKSLRSGDIPVAIVGGVNLILAPEVNLSFSKAGILSPDGRCKPFDNEANGIVRGEGVGAVILKTLEQAEIDGDTIVAVILGDAINQDGRSNGMTAPNPAAQVEVLRQAYESAGVVSDDIGYIEAHGTGTALGDPIECEALGRAVARDKKSGPCIIGSVKSNIGHLEAAAGIIGLIKTALVLRHSSVPKTIHFKAPNANIDFEAENLSLPTKSVPLTDNVAGVSSFGFGGTNVHVVLARHEIKKTEKVENQKLSNSTSFQVMTLSAQTRQGLLAILENSLAYIDNNSMISLESLTKTTSLHRDHLRYRIALAACSIQELRQKLEKARSEILSRDLSVNSLPKTSGRLAFVFSGQGSQWRHMGLDLMKSVPYFRRMLESYSNSIYLYTGWNVVDKIKADGQFVELDKNIEIIQPCIFAIQVSLARTYEFFGVTPDAVIGHSMGEVAAAYIGGGISRDDAIKIICERSRALERTRGEGKTVFVDSTEENIRDIFREYKLELSIAAKNSYTSLVISGVPKHIETFIGILTEKNIFHRIMRVETAAHSDVLDKELPSLQKALGNIQSQELALPMFSTVYGDKVAGENLITDYWVRNIREQVKFFDAIRGASSDGCDVFLEISPHAILTHSILQCVDSDRIVSNTLAAKDVLAVPTMLKDKTMSFADSLSNLYCSGINIDWQTINSDGEFLSDFPQYPWQREKCWFDKTQSFSERNFVKSEIGSLLGRQNHDPRNAEFSYWGSVVSVADQSYLIDHSIEGVPVFPASGYISIGTKLLEASNEGQEHGFLIRNVNIHQLLTLDSKKHLHTSISGKTISIYFADQSKDNWKLSATMEFDDVAERHCQGKPTSDSNSLELIEISRFYENTKQRGMEYGPTFALIAELRVGNRISEGCVNSSSDNIELIHPAVLDAIFQIGGASLKSDMKNNEEIFMPVAVKEFWLARKLTPDDHLSVYAYQNQEQEKNNGTYSVDIIVYDETDLLVAKIEALSLKAISSRPVNNDCFYGVEWASIPTASDGLERKNNKKTNKIAIFDQENKRLNPLYNRLQDAGYDVSYILADEGDKIAKEISIWEAQPDTIICSFLNVTKRTMTDYSLAIKQSEVAMKMLKALQKSWPDGTTSLIFPTSSTCLHSKSHKDDQIASSSIIGFLRSALWEMSTYSFALIDLEGKNEAKDTDSILEFVKNQSDICPRFGQFAFRNNKLCQAQINRLYLDGAGSFTAEPNGLYIISGGRGALGLETARFLAQRGAKAIALLGRSSATKAAIGKMDIMRQGGVSVYDENVDVSDFKALEASLKRLRKTGNQIIGVFHLAGVLDDSMIVNMEREHLVKSLAAKIGGADNLHRLTLNDPIENFVMFSSAASFVGSPGQANYSAANAYLDSLAHYRHVNGYPSQSINWSVWSDVGLAVSEERAGRLRRLGLKGISTELGIDILDRVLSSTHTQVAVLPLHQNRWYQHAKHLADVPYFKLLLASDGAEKSEGYVEFINELSLLDSNQQSERILILITNLVSEILKIPEDKILVNQSLVSMGMDSITAFELRSKLERYIKNSIPLIRLFDDSASILTVADAVETSLRETFPDKFQVISAELEVFEL